MDTAQRLLGASRSALVIGERLCGVSWENKVVCNHNQVNRREEVCEDLGKKINISQMFIV